MIISYSAGGAIVEIEVDATVREDHVVSSNVTDYHVERGSDPTDHIRPNPRQITCDVVVTNTPIRVPRTNTDGVTGGFHPVEIQTPTIPNIPRILPGAGLITSFLPQGQQTTKVEVLEFDGAMDRIRSVYNELDLLWSSATLVTISTRLRDYEQMVIQHLSAPRGPADGESITFSFTAKAIRFVDSEIVSVESDALKKKNAGVKPATQTDPKHKQSMLRAGVKKAEAFFSR